VIVAQPVAVELVLPGGHMVTEIVGMFSRLLIDPLTVRAVRLVNVVVVELLLGMPPPQQPPPQEDKSITDAKRIRIERMGLLE
jgi:hypothetical protein